VIGITITPFAEEGSGFLSSNVEYFTVDKVGQVIDGGGGRFRITSFEGVKKVFGYAIIPFYTTEAFSNFYYIGGFEPVWSDERGWPLCCLFYQSRLWFGGTRLRPLTVWGSRVEQLNDFNNIGNYENDGLSVDISSRENDAIVNLYGNRGLQIFTGGAEFVADEDSLTPDSSTVKKFGSTGSKDTVAPFDVEGKTLFIDSKGTNLFALSPGDYPGYFSADCLTLLNNQTISNPEDFAADYNSGFKDGNFVYVVNNNETMALANMLISQNINSFTRYETKSGIVKDVAVVKDTTYMVVTRDNKSYLEKVYNTKTDFTSNAALDNQDIIENLGDYVGMSARVYSSSVDYGEFTVSEEGAITLPEPITDMASIGLDIECELISNSLAIGGQTRSIKSRIAKAIITAANTEYIDFCGKRVIFSNNVGTALAVNNWGNDNKFTIKSKFNNVEVKSITLVMNYGN
jgi:hypothetical protein